MWVLQNIKKDVDPLWIKPLFDLIFGATLRCHARKPSFRNTILGKPI